MFNLRFVAAVIRAGGGEEEEVTAWLLSFCFAGSACTQCLCCSDVAAAVIFGFPSVLFEEIDVLSGGCCSLCWHVGVLVLPLQELTAQQIALRCKLFAFINFCMHFQWH